jgi:hypothetical protein
MPLLEDILPRKRAYKPNNQDCFTIKDNLRLNRQLTAFNGYLAQARLSGLGETGPNTSISVNYV